MTDVMKTYSLLTIVLLAGLIPASLAQSQPSPPVDPTAQALSTPPTFAPGMKQPADEVSNSDSTVKSSEHQRTFVGTVIKRRHEYVLKARDAEYLLDDHGKAKTYKGKLVQVTGNADENHIIRVKTIKLSSAQ